MVFERFGFLVQLKLLYNQSLNRAEDFFNQSVGDLGGRQVRIGEGEAVYKSSSKIIV